MGIKNCEFKINDKVKLVRDIDYLHVSLNGIKEGSIGIVSILPDTTLSDGNVHVLAVTFDNGLVILPQIVFADDIIKVGE